jgi:hypothetical protein
MFKQLDTKVYICRECQNGSIEPAQPCVLVTDSKCPCPENCISDYIANWIELV